jgi:hypothetical protein
VAVTVIVPLTSPGAGEVIETVGAVLSTVTVTGADVAVLVAVSLAVAVRE